MYENTPASELRVVGKGIERVDTKEKITGKAMYAGDLRFPGMLHAKLLTSPHARAKITKLDTSKAEKLPGVRAVLTGKDLNYKVGLYIIDKDVLVKDTVRHFGEAIAAVAADTPEIARKAIELIDIEYKVLPAVLDPVDAMKKNAPLVHPDLGSYKYVEAVFTPKPGTNIANHTKLRKGDVTKGFRESDYIVERTYTNPSVQHVPMETHTTIGQWREDGQITLWTSAQSPFTVRNLFCVALGVPHRDVRVIVPHVGGGFGGKGGIHLEPLMALLSKMAGGRHVKIVATREEEFSLLPCRSGLTYKIKTGLTKEGKIKAQQMTMYWQAGAYADYAVNVTRASGYSAGGPYEIPNAHLDAYTMYTNMPWGTAYRGFGHVEFSWGLERHMDLCAKTVKMDPLDFRLNNALKPGSVTLTGEKVHENTGNVSKCMEAAAKAINYGKLTASEKAREKRTGMKISKSVVGLHKAPAMPPFTASGCIVKLNEDGTATANFSLTEIGQGTYTSVQQIIAERLKFPVEKVKIVIENDTDYGPYDWQTVASKGLVISGNAAILAAEDLLKKAYHVAGQILRAQPCDLDNDGEKIFVRHHKDHAVTFAQISIGFAYPDGNGIGGPIIGVGSYCAQGLTNLNKETGQGYPALDWTYGSHGVVLEACPKTGAYNVIKVASYMDVGKAINEDCVRGQIIGGMIQGLGTAVCEGYIYNKEGQLLNPSFTDNKIPTSLDLPEEVIAGVVETPQIDGPYGARGVGEHSMVAICGAIGNAIQDSVGADLSHMPIMAQDVWKGMKTRPKKDAFRVK